MIHNIHLLVLFPTCYYNVILIETSDADIEDNVENERTSDRQNAPAMVDGKKLDNYDSNPNLNVTKEVENIANHIGEIGGQDIDDNDEDELVHKVTNVRIRDEIVPNNEIIESVEDCETPKAEWNGCDSINDRSSSEEKCDDEPEQQKELIAAGDDTKTKEHISVKNEWMTKSLTTLSPRYHPSSHECSIMSCLNQFTAPELLTGPNKFGCENCTLLKIKKSASKSPAGGIC